MVQIRIRTTVLLADNGFEALVCTWVWQSEGTFTLQAQRLQIVFVVVAGPLVK